MSNFAVVLKQSVTNQILLKDFYWWLFHAMNGSELYNTNKPFGKWFFKEIIISCILLEFCIDRLIRSGINITEFTKLRVSSILCLTAIKQFLEKKRPEQLLKLAAKTYFKRRESAGNVFAALAALAALLKPSRISFHVIPNNKYIASRYIFCAFLGCPVIWGVTIHRTIDASR